MPAEVVIRAEQLTKRYGATLAVDQIDIEVGAGEIVGILGPNGSGKTTTILMLLGLTEPKSPKLALRKLIRLLDALGMVVFSLAKLHVTDVGVPQAPVLPLVAVTSQRS